MFNFGWVVATLAERDEIVVKQLEVGQHVKVLEGSGSVHQAIKAGSGADLWSQQPKTRGPTINTGDIHPANYAGPGELFDGNYDNTDCLERAYTALKTKGSGRMLLPPRCKLRRPIIIDGADFQGPVNGYGQSAIICGDAANSTVLYWDPLPGYESDNAITIYSSVGNHVRGVSIRDLFVFGVNSPTGAAFDINTALFTHFERVWVRGFDGISGTGIKLTNGSQNSTFVACTVDGCDIGWYVEAAVATDMYGCRGNQNSSYNVHLVGCNRLGWYGGMIQGEPEFGLFLEPDAPGAVVGASFYDVYCELGVGTTSIVRVGNSDVNGFRWTGGVMSLNNTTGNFFDFATACYRFVIDNPTIGYSGNQKILKVRNGSAHGVFIHNPEFTASLVDLAVGNNFICWISSHGVSLNPAVPASVPGFIPPSYDTAGLAGLTPIESQIAYNSETHKHVGWNGSAWTNFY